MTLDPSYWYYIDAKRVKRDIDYFNSCKRLFSPPLATCRLRLEDTFWALLFANIITLAQLDRVNEVLNDGVEVTMKGDRVQFWNKYHHKVLETCV